MSTYWPIDILTGQNGLFKHRVGPLPMKQGTDNSKDIATTFGTKITKTTHSVRFWNNYLPRPHHWKKNLVVNTTDHDYHQQILSLTDLNVNHVVARQICIVVVDKFTLCTSFDKTCIHWCTNTNIDNLILHIKQTVWLNGLVVSALGIRARWPRFKSRVAPLFHWVGTLGKLFTHNASPQFLSSKKLGVQKGSFRRLSDYDD